MYVIHKIIIVTTVLHCTVLEIQLLKNNNVMSNVIREIARQNLAPKRYEMTI